jgi:glycosyltransferase involved in cell wall biosynthesis
MLTAVKRYALETEDWLRYNRAVRALLSRYALWTDRLAPAANDQALARSVGRLCAAARLTCSGLEVQRIQRSIRERVAQLDARRVDWSEFVPHSDTRHASRAVLLKPWLGPREKGVLFVSFEREWFKLYRHCDLDDLARRYMLVVAPSSSPHNIVNYVFPAVYPETVFSLLSNESDQEVLPRIAPNLVPVPLYASHWVNPRLFAPLPRDRRDFDVIMVAAFGKVKRHHVLFQAIRKMPGGLRILLVGQDQDARTGDNIRDQARWYGVHDRVTVLSNQTYAQVAQALCRARVSVILSRREGSCVVIAESMFADTPAAVLDNAVLGSRAFINEQTGRFLNEEALAEQLTDFVANADRYTPRRWALEHISCFKSSERLNEILKKHALATGQTWTRDLAPLTWCPDPCLVNREDAARLADATREFETRYGLEIGIKD